MQKDAAVIGLAAVSEKVDDAAVEGTMDDDGVEAGGVPMPAGGGHFSSGCDEPCVASLWALRPVFFCVLSDAGDAGEASGDEEENMGVVTKPPPPPFLTSFLRDATGDAAKVSREAVDEEDAIEAPVPGLRKAGEHGGEATLEAGEATRQGDRVSGGNWL